MTPSPACFTLRDKSMRTKLAPVLWLVGVGVVSVTALTLRAHACQYVRTNLEDGVTDGWRQRDLPPIPRSSVRG